jgi:hypothetical protein
MNNAIDQIKDLGKAVEAKALSNEQAAQRASQLIQGISTRLEMMVRLSDSNPAMFPALAEGVSIINRLIAMTGNKDPGMTANRDILIQIIEAKAGQLPRVGEGLMASMNTSIKMEVAKTEAGLMQFRGSSRDFFENPTFRALALSVHKNWAPLNPEATEITKNIVKDYFSQNGIVLSPGTTFRNVVAGDGKP